MMDDPCDDWGSAFYGEIEHPSAFMIARIQRTVADIFEIPCREMVSARRFRNVARPRQVAMYLSRKLTPRSLPEIGRRFGGRDHTTVIHAIERIAALRLTDAVLDEQIRTAQRHIEEAA